MLDTRLGISGRPGTLPQGPVPRGDTAPPGERPRDRVDVRPLPAPGHGGPGAVPTPFSDELAQAVEAARAHRDELMRKPHVLDVRAGYKFVGGSIRPEPAVVVVVDTKIPRDRLAAADRVPSVVGNVLTDVAPADPFERLARMARTEAGSERLPAPPRLLIDELQEDVEAVEEAGAATTYEPPPDGDLDPVTGAMTITCHVSPDAGWKILGPFLQATEKQVCLGMYDFTAPHIYQTARTLLKNDQVSWKQTLGPKESLPTGDDVDSTKADDLSEKQVATGLRRVAHERFENAFAHVGSGQTFASAYHIKVAVRDRKAFWLSSGNWQSSNQPDIDFLDSAAEFEAQHHHSRHSRG